MPRRLPLHPAHGSQDPGAEARVRPVAEGRLRRAGRGSYFTHFADAVAFALEALATILIAIAAVGAVVGLVRHGAGAAAALQRRRDVWVRLGVWLLLALEFELAADIVRTVIAPTWARLGQLAAIAVIRTFLNYFLEKDVERALKAERADWDSRAKAA